MEAASNFLDAPVEDVDVFGTLSRELKLLQGQHPERYSLPVYVLPAVDNDDEQARRLSFLQIKELWSGESIFLVPFNLGNHHWIGITIKFDAQGQIERAELADPVINSSFQPDKLHKEFTQIFQSSCTCAKNVLKHEDSTRSARLTVANLVQAAQQMQSSLCQDQRQGKDVSFQETELRSGSAASGIIQLESSPSKGFEKLHFHDVSDLSRQISETSERLERLGDADGGEKTLKETQKPLKLFDCSTASQQWDSSGNTALSQLEERLKIGFAKWKIEDMTQLREELDNTQRQIDRYRRMGQKKEIKGEEKNLEEFKELLALAEEIDVLKRSTDDSAAKLSKLKRKLKDGLAKWKINDVTQLSEEIQSAQQLLQRYERMDEIAEAEQERQNLRELVDLQKLSAGISAMEEPVGHGGPVVYSCEQKLREGLEKWKLKDIAQLQEEIHNTHKQIDKCARLGRRKEADEEQKTLCELKELLALTENIAGRERSANKQEAELAMLEQTLDVGLRKWRIEDPSQLSTEIEQVEKQIERYKRLGKTEDVTKERESLQELLRLRKAWEEICQLRSRVNNPAEHPTAQGYERSEQTVSDTVSKHEVAMNPCDPVSRRRQELKNLREDIESMPVCAERTVLQLIEHSEKKISVDNASNEGETSEMSAFENLRDQLKQEELFSEGIRDPMNELHRNIHSQNWSLVMRNLTEALKQIRPLHVQEIKRLVEKTREAATLIRGQEIVLLIGVTGSGKSTTIQFLAGAPMRNVDVEVLPGQFLEHVAAVGSVDNPDLQGVTTSPLSKSETRFIHSVRVDLKKVIGTHASGEIILCDAPGFGDTAGPEVDIANGVGVIEALKECKSVKILALSSYKSVGDRGQGIQKLAHMLVNMIPSIRGRLDSILYGFTKYPASTNIHALLSEFKQSTVDQDPSLNMDSSFVTLLSDMIKKTKTRGAKIDPIHQTPQDLLENLLQIDGIEYPAEVFHFSMSEETKGCIAHHVQITKSRVICAMKNRNLELVKYYLNGLKLVRDLINVSVTRDAYEDAVRVVNQSITNSCSHVMRQFNRALQSHDGLREEDVSSYESALRHLENVQLLKEHLGPELASPDLLLTNIQSEMQTRTDERAQEDVASPSIGVYLGNLRLLTRLFRQLEPDYAISCKQFAARVEELLHSTQKTIHSHDFKGAAEHILKLSKCARTLEMHVEQAEAKYMEAVQFLLNYLQGFADKVTPILVRPELSETGIETIQEYVETLKPAKENPILQDRVLDYVERCQKQPRHLQKVQDMSEIYDLFIEKIVRYFAEISERIKERFEKNESYALEHIEKLVNNMEAIRRIPELELRTAEIYYRTVEHIRGYTQQLQKEAEHALLSLDQGSVTVNYARLARSLLRLKNAEWINRVTPGAYEFMMRHITEELVEQAQRLEDTLIKIDLSLKCPENVAGARTIVEATERMRVLERSVPELVTYRERISDRFVKCVQGIFDRIQKKFNLQDNTIYQVKQELTELEEIKKEYDSLHPSRIYLKEQGYAQIELLHEEMENLEKQHDDRLKSNVERREEFSSEVTRLNAIVQEYMGLNAPKGGLRKVQRALNSASTTILGNESEASKLLKARGYLDINQVYKAITDTQEALDSQVRSKESTSSEFELTMSRLKTTRQKYKHLVSSDSVMPSEQQRSLLQHKRQDTIEVLEKAIEHKKRTVAESTQRKQTYNFGDRLDAAAANNAFLYIQQCEQVSVDRVREMAADTRSFLEKYVNEYAHFLNSQIEIAFRQLTVISAEGLAAESSNNLEPCVQELFVFDKFPELYKSIAGDEKITFWKEKFLEYNRLLGVKMEQDRVAGSNRELKDRLGIAYRLSCLDRFCSDVLGVTGFGALYRQYHLEITKETRQAYRTVLDHIAKEDYANADIALSEIDDHPLHQRDLAQIKLDLHRSLNKVMKDTESTAKWLSGKIERDAHCRDEIQLIKGNIDKVRIAVTKQSILQLLDSDTRLRLMEFDRQIDGILSTTILQGLRSIESFMGVDGFAEAEQGLENIGLVIGGLSGYCTSTEIIEKYTDLRKRLEEVVKEIETRDNFDDIAKYPENPPKELLAKLQVVASRGDVRYKQAYQLALGKIRQTFNKTIEEARKAPLNERATRIRELNYVLCFLPDELQAQVKFQIEEVHRLFTDEEQTCKRDLEEIASLADDDDHTIRRIGALAERHMHDRQTVFFGMLREKVLKNLSTARNNVETRLKQQEMSLALDTSKKIFKYRVILSSPMPEVLEIYDSVCVLVINASKTYCDTLTTIAKIEKTQVVENALRNILVFITFSHTFDNHIQQILSDEAAATVSKALDEVCRYLTASSQQFPDALSTMNIAVLCQTMKVAKRWDGLLRMIKESRAQSVLVQGSFPDMSAVISHEDMISALEKQVVLFRTRLQVDLMNDHTVKFEHGRDTHLSEIMAAINILREIRNELKDVFPLPVDVERSEEQVTKRIRALGTQLLTIAEKEQMTESHCDIFRKNYAHLLSIEKHLRIDEASVRQYLTGSEEHIFRKVARLGKEIEKSQVAIEKAAEILIEAKFLAENLSMFDAKINAQIDEMLKKYKSKVSRSQIVDLTMILEKKDVGCRLIGEHTALSGEDWRKRREKTQNQDNLEYVLNKLTGDDLDTDALRRRYETFKTSYHRLVNANLPKQEQKTQSEPDLDGVTSALKLLVEKIAPQTESVALTQSLKDKMPEILAHIFAVWTLKNTQHYNASRRIEEEKAYLLMPHVGQVIAIFRILGLGYKENRKFAGMKVPLTGKIPDDLINNLVQVGTGEGKSVVMAVTACVFALIGVDVSCSCYSEVLSSRDRDDFAAIFRALGVEERIAYGTFNKLCEDLLNEQCNIREKVREMIISNVNVIEKAEIKTPLRRRVLLIDEVDVFLSEKYYGGMYSPAVHLKDASIKALLDALWQNKTIRSLNGVKALPAYEQCASRFSNWIFLFDEAIKDMLAALQSFESSTYIVREDRIVYIVGESIVENVVRGYDTIWAHYKEHAKNKITLASLEQNVGIIIHCGAFSYAEMPLEYAYIAGVTGTLETLAKPEKKILKEIYMVHKSTYMPSVFGKSNRNFNSANDVQAVSDSEYFTRIRGDIDSMCRAKRAILVFFESEKKLLAFYDSEMIQPIRESVQIITERIAAKERELAIKRAATEGKVTLSTRTFGRGTDFICRNQNVLANGGVHVLQTYFSQELSEEYQIMGRTARHGELGSYRMILLDSDLEWVLGSNWKEDLPKITGSVLYQNLNQARNSLYESRCGAKELGIAQCKKDHGASRAFLRALSLGEMPAIKAFLLEQNRGANLVTGSARTVLLMDATGSMSSLLSAAKDTVCTMFERAASVLEQKGLPSDAFQMQFVVYRDYDCRSDGLLQSSPWETKAANLRSFMVTVSAKGGGDYEEAIEIGLWHAFQESEQPEGVSQVILIGDAPAKDPTAINRDRQAAGGERYWDKTKYKLPTHYLPELQKLKDKKIPVHAFYVAEGAKDNFQEIADTTGGRCEFLHIQSSKGAESLTNFVTEEVLRKAAGDQGDAAVELYRKKYVKTAYTS